MRGQDIELTGVMREEFSKALLSAFPKVQDLARFVKFALDWELEQVTEGTLDYRVLALIGKAEAEGAVHRLIRLAEWEKPANPKLKKFLQGHLLALPYSVPMLKRLHDVLSRARVPVGVLFEVANAVVNGYMLPDDWALLPENIQSIELLESLASSPLTGTRPSPLHAFVLRLARRPEATSISNALRDWLMLAGQSMKIPPSEMEAFWKCTEADASSNPLYLMVKIDLQGADEYVIKAWLSGAQGDNCDVVFGGDGKPYPLNGLDSQIHDVLEHVRRRHGKRLLEARNELTLELFLPRKLLCHSFESILIEGGASERIPLGIKYGVVVRSAERIETPRGSSLRFSWDARWRAFRSGGSGSTPILIRKDEETRNRQLIARMSDEKDFVLALGLSLPASPRAHEEDLLTKWIIRTGMPIAFWLRDGTPIEEARLAEFEGLLDKVSELPQLVRAKRKEGFSQGEEHLGNHLTLLWDDPERLPLEFGEDADLEAPATLEVHE